jgi:hypothetical protein
LSDNIGAAIARLASSLQSWIFCNPCSRNAGGHALDLPVISLKLILQGHFGSAAETALDEMFPATLKRGSGAWIDGRVARFACASFES